MHQVVDTGLVIDNIKTLLKSAPLQSEFFTDFIDRSRVFSDKLETILLNALGGDIKSKSLCDRIDSAVTTKVLAEIRTDAATLLEHNLLIPVIHNLAFKHQALGALFCSALLMDKQFFPRCAAIILNNYVLGTEGFKALFISLGKDRLTEIVSGIKDKDSQVKVPIPRPSSRSVFGLGAAAYNLGLELPALISLQEDLYQNYDDKRYGNIIALNDLIHGYISEIENSSPQNQSLVNSANQFFQRMIFNDASVHEVCINTAIECCGRIGGFNPDGVLMSFLKDPSRCMQYTLAKIISQIPEDQMDKENVALLTYTMSPNRKLLVRGTAVARIAHSNTKEAKERFEALLLGENVKLTPSDQPSPNFIFSSALIYSRAFHDYFSMSGLNLNVSAILNTMADKRFCLDWYRAEDHFIKQLDSLNENGAVARYSALAGLDLRRLMLDAITVNKLFERELKADAARVDYYKNRTALIDFYLKGSLRVKHIVIDQFRTLLETKDSELKKDPKLHFAKEALEYFLNHAPARDSLF